MVTTDTLMPVNPLYNVFMNSHEQEINKVFQNIKQLLLIFQQGTILYMKFV